MGGSYMHMGSEAIWEVPICIWEAKPYGRFHGFVNVEYDFPSGAGEAL
jgi:hypothetical protein